MTSDEVNRTMQLITKWRELANELGERARFNEAEVIRVCATDLCDLMIEIAKEVE